MAFAPGEVLTLIDQPHDFAPGTGWNYSSSNYVVIGLVIEAVTNKPLHENLRNRFFSRGRPGHGTYLVRWFRGLSRPGRRHLDARGHDRGAG